MRGPQLYSYEKLNSTIYLNSCGSILPQSLQIWAQASWHLYFSAQGPYVHLAESGCVWSSDPRKCPLFKSLWLLSHWILKWAAYEKNDYLNLCSLFLFLSLLTSPPGLDLLLPMTIHPSSTHPPTQPAGQPATHKWCLIGTKLGMGDAGLNYWEINGKMLREIASNRLP